MTSRLTTLLIYMFFGCSLLIVFGMPPNEENPVDMKQKYPQIVFGMPSNEEKPIDMKQKYLRDIVQDDSCLEEFIHYGLDETSPPSDKNPIQYLYMFEKCKCFVPPDRAVPYTCEKFDGKKLKLLKCLDRLAAQETPHLEIVTCRHPRFRGWFMCAPTKEKFQLYWYPQIFGSAVALYSAYNDDETTKKIVLFASIVHKQHHLTKYLLTQKAVIGKEHLAAALSVGNDSLFYQLVEPFTSKNSIMTRLLGFPTKPDKIRILRYEKTNYVPRPDEVESWIPKRIADIPEIAIRRDYEPSLRLLDFLYTYIDVRTNHFYHAIWKNDPALLEYLMTKKKHGLEKSGASDRSLYQTVLGMIVEYGDISRIESILEEKTNWDDIYHDEESKQILLAFAAKGRGDIAQIMELLQQKIALKIEVDHVIKVIYSGADYETVMWFINHCDWTREGMQAVSQTTFKHSNNILAESNFGASVGFKPSVMMGTLQIMKIQKMLQERLDSE